MLTVTNSSGKSEVHFSPPPPVRTWDTKRVQSNNLHVLPYLLLLHLLLPYIKTSHAVCWTQFRLLTREACVESLCEPTQKSNNCPSCDPERSSDVLLVDSSSSSENFSINERHRCKHCNAERKQTVMCVDHVEKETCGLGKKPHAYGKLLYVRQPLDESSRMAWRE